ncbi:MAG: hypothetical protein KGL16_04875 [Acidobacteriota bacterium]|nr:hypothetical protein [Acidobacteriota bacterium]
MPARRRLDLARYRNWALAAVLVAVVVLVTVLAAKQRPRGPRPAVAFGAQVRQLGATRDLSYTNAWTATGGGREIAVYAGGERLNRRDGLFVILRRTRHRRQLARVVVRGSGSVTLLRPARPSTIAAAFGATLRFVTANGGTGMLALDSDRVLVNR